MGFDDRTPREGAETAPLSIAQERFWRRRGGEARGGLVSCVPALFRLAGPLDTAALRGALSAVFERHEALRTTFAEVDGQAVQIVHPETEAALPLVDLAALPPAVQAAEVRRIVLRDSRTPFDLEAGPLLRLRLCRCAPDEHLLACIVHHIAFDGWSEALLVGELTALYGAFRRRAPSPLEPLPVQVRDHAWRQRDPARAALRERQRHFWREALRGAVPLDLSALRPRTGSGGRSGLAGSERVEVPAELSRAVQGLSARAGATPFMTLLAAFQAVLSRAAGQPDVTVTSLFANRAQPGAARLIGNFFTALPLRVRIDGRQDFRDLLGRVRAATLAAQDNADVLFEEILDEAGAAGSDPAAAFRVRFALQNLPAAPAANGSGVAVSPVPFDTGRIRQDLVLLLSREGDRLAGRLRYDTGALDPAAVAWIRDGFLSVLYRALADPQRPLDELLAGLEVAQEAAITYRT